MEPKIQFEFNKVGISITTGEHLMDKVTNEELKAVLKIAIEGKHLKLEDANFLVQSLLAAIIINNDFEGQIIKPSEDSEKGKNKIYSERQCM